MYYSSQLVHRFFIMFFLFMHFDLPIDVAISTSYGTFHETIEIMVG